MRKEKFWITIGASHIIEQEFDIVEKREDYPKYGEDYYTMDRGALVLNYKGGAVEIKYFYTPTEASRYLASIIKQNIRANLQGLINRCI